MLFIIQFYQNSGKAVRLLFPYLLIGICFEQYLIAGHTLHVVLFKITWIGSDIKFGLTLKFLEYRFFAIEVQCKLEVVTELLKLLIE